LFIPIVAILFVHKSCMFVCEVLVVRNNPCV
jgi:hypothetical protein